MLVTKRYRTTIKKSEIENVLKVQVKRLDLDSDRLKVRTKDGLEINLRCDDFDALFGVRNVLTDAKVQNGNIVIDTYETLYKGPARKWVKHR